MTAEVRNEGEGTSFIDNSNSLMLVWGGAVISILLGMAIPEATVPVTLAFYVIMWRWKRSDPYLDWNARETIRATLMYTLYMWAIVFVGLAADGISEGYGSSFKPLFGATMWAFMIFVLLNCVRQIIAVHRNWRFVYPATFSPRRHAAGAITGTPMWVFIGPWLIFLGGVWGSWQSTAPERNQRIVDRALERLSGAETPKVTPPLLPAAVREDHLLAANSQVYLCDSAARVREFFEKATQTAYFDSTQLIASYGQAYCPQSTPTALVSGSIVHDEVLTQNAAGYDRLRIVSVDMQKGPARFTVLMRASSTGLWHDGITTIFTLRTVGGVAEWLQELQRRNNN